MPGYQTKQESVRIVGAANPQMRSLLDRQSFSDPLQVARRLGIPLAHWPKFGLLRPSGVHLVGHRRGADMTASYWHPLAAAFLLATVQTRLQTLVRTRFCTHDEYESSFDMRSGRWPREEPSALGYRRWGTQNGESGSRSGGALED